MRQINLILLNSVLVLLIIPGFSQAAPHILAAPSKAVESPVNISEGNITEGNPHSLELNERGVAAVQARNTKLAEDLFRQALAADDKNLTAVFNLAGMLLTNQKEDQAVKLLEDYVARYPSDAGLYARLGDAYFGSKNPPKARAAYERALELDPQVEGVPIKLATVYSLTNQLAKAEAMLLRAAEQNPKDPQILANLSAVFLARGNTENAISTARRAIQLKPTKEVYITLGTAYELTKDYQNSLISLKRAQDLGDNRPELKQKIAEVEQKVASKNG